MGNVVGSPSTEIDEKRRWLFENVLFFDGERESDTVKKQVTFMQRSRGGVGCVKRFTPSSARLCGRNFLIFFDLGTQKKKEYLLKLQNQPHCRMLLCDKAGELIKEIRTSRLKHVERLSAVTVEVFVRTDVKDLSSFRFDFESSTECDLFAEFLAVLFGIQVHHIGVKHIEKILPPTTRIRRADPEESSSSSNSDSEDERFYREVASRTSARQSGVKRRDKQEALQHRVGCPLHGNRACRCNVERVNLNVNDDESLSEDTSEVEASLSDKYPLIIEGLCEAGCIVTVKDVPVHQLSRQLPRVVEWFLSNKPGNSPSFPLVPSKTGASFRLSEADVGHYVQVRVLRRLEGLSAANPFVYSLARKGPITVNNDTAHAMLRYLSQNDCSVEALADHANLHQLFELPVHFLQNTRPFFDLNCTLRKSGVMFEARVRDATNALKRECPWQAFYVLRPEAEEVDIREDNITLVLNVLNYDLRSRRYLETQVNLRLPSESVRDHIFHVARLFRLSGKMPSYERWAEDLQQGNCTRIKQYYARMWAAASWESYIDLSCADRLPPPKWATQRVVFPDQYAALAQAAAAAAAGGSAIPTDRPEGFKTLFNAAVVTDQHSEALYTEENYASPVQNQQQQQRISGSPASAAAQNISDKKNALLFAAAGKHYPLSRLDTLAQSPGVLKQAAGSLAGMSKTQAQADAAPKQQQLQQQQQTGAMARAAVGHTAAGEGGVQPVAPASRLNQYSRFAEIYQAGKIGGAAEADSDPLSASRNAGGGVKSATTPTPKAKTGPAENIITTGMRNSQATAAKASGSPLVRKAAQAAPVGAPPSAARNTAVAATGKTSPSTKRREPAAKLKAEAVLQAKAQAKAQPKKAAGPSGKLMRSYAQAS